MTASVTMLVLGFGVLAIVALLTAIVQFKSLTGVASMAMIALTGWYMAAAVTPPSEYEGVNVQIVHVPLPAGSETLAVARHPATGKNIVWRYEGKPNDKLMAFFPDNTKPRLHLTGVLAEDKPRLVHQ